MPSALQASTKHNLMNITPIGEDLGASKKTLVPSGASAKSIIRHREKAQVGRRKALGDLTNSVKQFSQQQDLKKPCREKKLISVAQDKNLPNSITEEQFLHNHHKCIKSNSRALDLHQFLTTIGLDEDVSMQSSRKSKVDESPKKLIGMEELPEMIMENKTELLSGESSPVCGSPKFPRLLYMNKDYENFILAETPRLSK